MLLDKFQYLFIIITLFSYSLLPALAIKQQDKEIFKLKIEYLDKYSQAIKSAYHEIKTHESKYLKNKSLLQLSAYKIGDRLNLAAPQLFLEEILHFNNTNLDNYMQLKNKLSTAENIQAIVSLQSFEDNELLVELQAISFDLNGKTQKFTFKTPMKIQTQSDINSIIEKNETQFMKWQKNFINAVKETSEISTATLVGAIDAIQIGGIGTAIGTSGLSLIPGVILGAAAGIYNSIKKLLGLKTYSSKSKKLERQIRSRLNHSAEFMSFEFLEEPKSLDNLLEILNKQEIQYTQQKIKPISINLFSEGDFEILDINGMYSHNFGNTILIDLKICNKFSKTLSFYTFILEDSLAQQSWNYNQIQSLAEELSQANTTDRTTLIFNIGDYSKVKLYDFKLKIYDVYSGQLVSSVLLKRKFDF